MGDIRYLSDEEVQDFLNSLDSDKDGYISYAEIEDKLDQVHDEIAPVAEAHNLHHESRTDVERHHFLRTVIGIDADRISTADFSQTVKSWRIPSLVQERAADKNSTHYVKSLPLGRRIRAHLAVDGPETAFLTLVISLQIAFGVWQCVKYATEPQWQAAFGWGVVLSKTSAGVLYPTLFFLVISMSRWLATLLRKFYGVSRFINWDLSQEFHVRISIVALFFATTHTIGHLAGTMLTGSRPGRQPAVAQLLGRDAVPRSYRDYVASLPGWTGVVAYGLFWIIALLSLPTIRRWNFEVFQLGHLLMFPMIAMLMAHGTEALLQFPMLGYWLALPTLLVIFERGLRFYRGFVRIPARLEALDADTVCIKATIPVRRHWPYRAGQFVMLQIPQISFFQWHPFTVSACIGNEMQLHIKTDGNWTSQLQNLREEQGTGLRYIGIDGPFGAPAQRFYDYEYSIVVGAGIGITPFAGILTDLKAMEAEAAVPQALDSEKLMQDHPLDTPKDEIGVVHTTAEPTPCEPACALPLHRRVDFHWIVRDRNYLLWFSDLLNHLSSPSARAKTECLDVRITTHVTKKRTHISTHIFRHLLERHRTEQHRASPLTGLINPTHFGRPDLAQIMDEHDSMMREVIAATTAASDEKDGLGKRRQRVKRRRVGVFYCGAPQVGYELSDRCRMLTLRGREDRTFLEYQFMMEVF